MKDKVVLITGSSRGIGKHIALAFAKKSATVIVHGAGNSTRTLTYTADAVRAISHCDQISFDVSSSKNVTHGIKTIVDKFGTIDILVNNAGNFENNTVKKMPKCSWDTVINTNLTGIFNCTHAVLNWADPIRIINITSILGQTGVFGGANYAAAKAGIIGFTKSVAKEIARGGATANAVALGYISAGMTDQLPHALIDKVIENTPMKRLGTPEEVTDVILFLASEKASFITGQTINVNGGLYM